MTLNRFSKYVLAAILLLGIMSFSACSVQENSSLRIGMNTWPGYEPFALAKSQKFLAKNVNISRVDSATDVIKAFKSDIIDVACVTLDEAVILQDKSQDKIKIITIMDFSTGGDVVIARKSIASMLELKGKRVGVESSALGAFMISRAVDKTEGLELSEIKIINLGYEHHEKEFLEGNIDAVVTFEPVKTKLLQEDAHVIFDSRQIPGEILDVMIVKEKTMKMKRKALEEMVKAWYKSVDYIAKNTNESMRLMAGYEKISLKEFELAYAGIQVPSFDESRVFFSKELRLTIAKVQKILSTKKLISTTVDPQTLYSDEFLKR